VTPNDNGPVQEELLAIIDLGTNTFHLLLVSIRERETLHILEKFKENVKLGEGGITQGRIAPAAFERGIKALKKYRKIIDSRGKPKVLAFATSAIRGASNGPAFLQEAREKAGIEIRIINGNEEAALIYQGVRHGVPLPSDRDVLIVDIGGGSVEFIVANGNNAKLLRSLKIGASRVFEMVQPSDRISPAQIEQMREFYRAELADLMEELREFNITSIIGSSGTFETLGALIAVDQGETHVLDNLNCYKFDERSFRRVSKRILESTRSERLNFRGLDPARVDLIVPGSVLVGYLLETLQVTEIVVSAFALKEGILYQYMSSQRSLEPLDLTAREERDRTVKQLAKKYNSDRKHCELVTQLALSLYDQSTYLHGYGDMERELLRHAARMHDIGHFVNNNGHHKHAQYIIINSNLPGFSSDELLLMGNLVRYHRKSLPSHEHLHFNLLYREHKDMVRRLAGILRIADNLDRTKRGLVQNVELRAVGRDMELIVLSDEHADIEIEHTSKETQLFEVAFDCTLLIKQG
jgi:exopolyphosphatase / guanosine-5'-triphosphate,3'-diphosphate pyrophosphatase